MAQGIYITGGIRISAGTVILRIALFRAGGLVHGTGKAMGMRSGKRCDRRLILLAAAHRIKLNLVGLPGYKRIVQLGIDIEIEGHIRRSVIRGIGLIGGQKVAVIIIQTQAGGSGLQGLAEVDLAGDNGICFGNAADGRALPSGLDRSSGKIRTDHTPAGVGKTVIVAGIALDIRMAAQILMVGHIIRFIDSHMAIRVSSITAIYQNIARLGLHPLIARPTAGQGVGRIVAGVAYSIIAAAQKGIVKLDQIHTLIFAVGWRWKVIVIQFFTHLRPDPRHGFLLRVSVCGCVGGDGQHQHHGEHKQQQAQCFLDPFHFFSFLFLTNIRKGSLYAARPPSPFAEPTHSAKWRYLSNTRYILHAIAVKINKNIIAVSVLTMCIAEFYLYFR